VRITTMRMPSISDWLVGIMAAIIIYAMIVLTP
jgi:hypothetical protein